MDRIPRKVDSSNIDEAVEMYLSTLRDIPLTIKSESLLELLAKLKRDKIGTGPYPNETVFESANRIMTDLVILFGVRILLRDNPWGFPFEQYKVELGNENDEDHDITSIKGSKTLRGEAFNVAPSFFQGKKSNMLRKLRANAKAGDIRLIVFNSDAVSADYKARVEGNEFYLPVEVSI